MKLKFTIYLLGGIVLMVFSNYCGAQSMKQRVKRLEMRVERLDKSVSTLRRQNKVLKDSIASLKIEIQRLKGNDDDMEKAIPASAYRILEKVPSVRNNLSQKIAYKDKTFDTYLVENGKDIQLFWKNNDQSIRFFNYLRHLLVQQEKQLVFAMNAGMYTKEFAPQGLYIENGQELSEIDRHKDKYGNFYMQPNGIFLVDASGQGHVITTEKYDQFNGDIQQATQSGPMLVIDGEINNKFSETATSVHYRNGVGIDRNGRVIFIISNQQVNLYTFAKIFKDHFGCKNALYLDGNISKMYLPELDREQLGGPFGPIIGITK